MNAYALVIVLACCAAFYIGWSGRPAFVVAAWNVIAATIERILVRILRALSFSR